MYFITSLDFTILNWIHDNMTGKFLDVFMLTVSTLGNRGFIFITVMLILMSIKKYRKIGVAIGLALLIGVILCNLIMKPFFARIRPCEINTDVILLIGKIGGYSFPSGHTTAAFETASVLFFNNRLWGAMAIGFAVLMGFSRIYLYVHFPTDVIFGAALGFMIGFIAKKLVDIYFEFDLKKHKKILS